VSFIEWTTRAFARVKKKPKTLRRLEQVSGTIPIDIALGYNQSLKTRKNKYFESALHAGVESAGMLDILQARQTITESELGEGKKILSEMLTLLKEYIGEDEEHTKPHSKEKLEQPHRNDLIA
jgi:hypothetical protein